MSVISYQRDLLILELPSSTLCSRGNAPDADSKRSINKLDDLQIMFNICI
jgi:hypothetical protein